MSIVVGLLQDPLEHHPQATFTKIHSPVSQPRQIPATYSKRRWKLVVVSIVKGVHLRRLCAITCKASHGRAIDDADSESLELCTSIPPLCL